MTLSERLKELINYSGKSVRAFALDCGLNQAVVDRYIKGKAIPTSSALATIAKFYPEVSCEWLLVGEGSMLKSDNENKRINRLLETIETLQEAITLQKDTIAILKARNLELEQLKK